MAEWKEVPKETQWNEAAMRTGKTAVRKEGSPSKGHDRLAIATFGEVCAGPDILRENAHAEVWRDLCRATDDEHRFTC